MSDLVKSNDDSVDLMNNENYMNRFAEKIDELQNPELESVVKTGKYVAGNTDFEFMKIIDKVIPIIAKSKLLKGVADVFKTDPSEMVDDPMGLDIGVIHTVTQILHGLHIKRFIEILIARANAINHSSKRNDYAFLSVPKLLDATFDPTGSDENNEVFLFDLLRVYMFNGPDYGTPLSIDLGGQHQFNSAGVEDAINHRKKRTMSDVLDRAVKTFNSTPLFSNPKIAMAALGLYGMSLVGETGLSPPSAEANAAPNAVPNDQPTMKDKISTLKNAVANSAVGKAVGNKFNSAMDPLKKKATDKMDAFRKRFSTKQKASAKMGGRRTRRRRRNRRRHHSTPK